MISTRPLFLSVIGLSLVLTGCMLGQVSPHETTADPRPPAPLPSGATALVLATAPPETVAPANWACPLNTITAAHMVREGDAVVFRSVGSEQALDLVWPRGFSARLRNGVAEVVAPDGKVIVREGETFSDIVGGPPNICWVDGIYYPPAS
jgi:hypothetical protein